jgi:iron complex transport system substrate-binding protein
MITRFLAFLLLLASTAVAVAQTPSRIVSINLCADALLLALANPAQITALSPYATDPTMSFMASSAAAFRHDAADAETVVDLNPDLVLAGRFTKRATREMLIRLGYRVVLLDPARSIEQSIDQIREVADLVGHPGRADALIEQIEEARTLATWAAGPAQLSAAVYQRRGYVTGAETLTGELMEIVGFVNEGGSLAGATGAFVPLERLVADRPDFLIVASPRPPAEDQGAALLAHPALERLYPPERRIILPERLTVCGGPSLPAALDWLATEARRASALP